jgi:hypothetical protein
MASCFIAQKANPGMTGVFSRPRTKIRMALICLVIGSSVLFARHLGAQAADSAPAAQAPKPLTQVAAVVEQEDKQTHNLGLLSTLTKTDFRLFDNGHEVPIQSFSAGMDRSRPIALWLIVQCNMGIPDDQASGFIRGKTQYLTPALRHLEDDDLIGVAHWCEDGQAKIDVAPGTSVDAALQGVETVLAAPAYLGHNAQADLALWQMVQLVTKSSKAQTPARLPVLLFLHGDFSGDQGTIDVRISNQILTDITGNSGLVFGLGVGTKDQNALESMRSGGVAGHFVHNFCVKSGGQYYTTARPELFAPTLDYILSQLHLRYTLGFAPAKLDGKTHDLRVELTKDAQKRFPKTTLRFRGEYVASPPAQ